MCDTAKPPITQIYAIRMVLNRYIDVVASRRRTLRNQDKSPVLDHYGQRRKRAPLREEFDDPAFDAAPYDRIQVDLGTKLKPVVEELIADIGISKSRFFSFLLSEAASTIEGKAQGLQTSIGVGAQQPDLAESAG
jgi:hypothetical protein